MTKAITKTADRLPPSERRGVGLRFRRQLNGDQLGLVAQNERVEVTQGCPDDPVVGRVVDNDRLLPVRRTSTRGRVVLIADTDAKLQEPDGRNVRDRF